MGSFTERQNFSKFVSLDVEEAGKEHFTNEQGFFRSRLPILYFGSIGTLFEALGILEGFKYTANSIRYLETLIHLMQIKPLHSGVT